jgi:hypothetical protein
MRGKADHVGNALFAEAPHLALNIGILGEAIRRQAGAIGEARDVGVIGDQPEACRDADAITPTTIAMKRTVRSRRAKL